MKKIILYVNNNGKYDILKFDNLGEGQKAFTQKQKKGNFTYLELGIDSFDIDGKYKIVRKVYN